MKDKATRKISLVWLSHSEPLTDGEINRLRSMGLRVKRTSAGDPMCKCKDESMCDCGYRHERDNIIIMW